MLNARPLLANPLDSRKISLSNLNVMQWKAVEEKLLIYENRSIWKEIEPMVILALGMPAVMGVAFSLTFIGVPFYLAISAMVIGALAFFLIWDARDVALHCPHCRQGISTREEIMILKNMHQCPHCQTKFPD